MKESTEKSFTSVGKKSVAFVDKLINWGVALLLLLMVSYGIYSIYDSRQILNAAKESQYATYKPKANDQASFSELAKKNPDVFGWLNVYGTQIDYPVLQGKTNETYLNTDPLGNYKLSGSIFLDYRNQKDFSDFNSIIYGHHMAASAMFGDLDKFNNQDFFNDHQYGDLYYGKKHHGIEFFAFINGDAFDTSIYQTPVNQKQQADYLINLKSKARYYRELSLTSTDRLVLLSTCTSDYTNGRHLLVGRITNQAIAIPNDLKARSRRSNSEFSTKAAGLLRMLTQTSKRRVALFILLFILLLCWYVVLVVKRKKQEERASHE